MESSAERRGALLKLPGLGVFRRVPTGTASLGNEGVVRDWDGGSFAEHAANGPRRIVQFRRSIAMLETPVTVAAFCALGADVGVLHQPVFVLPESRSISDGWTARPFAAVNARDELPVVGVTWDDAVAFCVTASDRFRCRVRLPTELEWEYAARAGASSVYAWGDEVHLGLDYAWSDRNSGGVVQPVGLLRSNAWGLFDMAGNVWEWCANRFDWRAEGDRRDQRSIRGGSACHHATAGRSAHRFGMRASQRNAFLGFRCVVELDTLHHDEEPTW